MHGSQVDPSGEGTCERDLELQLRELRSKTYLQEQCIEQYKLETQKLMLLSENENSSEIAHGMMKVWLRDARQQSDDLRRLFDESKAIAAETLSATKREMGSKITTLHQQVAQLEKEAAESTKTRVCAEEAAEKLRHELITTKRNYDLLRSELATTSSEMCGKLSVRQNVTKGEICKLSAEVFTLQQNLMEQAQKSAEAGKKGANAYQQDLVSLNGLLERSREMRERDRASFAAALEIAHSDLREKETALREIQDNLQSVTEQLSKSRQDTAELSQHVAGMKDLANASKNDSNERIVRAARIKAHPTLLRIAIAGWWLVARPGQDVSSRLNAIHSMRWEGRVFMQWRANVCQQIRYSRKIIAAQQRFKTSRLLSNYVKWRFYVRARHQLMRTSYRIRARHFESTRLLAFQDWHLKSSATSLLQRKQMRATAHWNRSCKRHVIHVLKWVSVEGRWYSVQGVRFKNRMSCKGTSRSLHAWFDFVASLKDSATSFNSNKMPLRGHWLLISAFGRWFSECAISPSGDNVCVQVAGLQRRRRRICTVLCCWQQHAMTRKQWRLNFARANLHLQAARKKRATRRLRTYLCYQQSNSLRLRRMSAKTVRNIFYHTIRTWSDVSASKNTWSIKVSRCEIRCKRTKLAQIWRHWQAAVKHARVAKVSKERADSKCSVKRTMGAYTRFADHCLETRAVRRKGFLMAQKRHGKLAARMMCKWVNSMVLSRHRTRKDYTTNSRRNMLKLANLRTCARWWLEHAHWKRVLNRLGLTVTSKGARRHKLEVLHAWYDDLKAEKRRSACVQRLQYRRHVRIISSLFDSWSQSMLVLSLQITGKREVEQLSEELRVVKGALDLALSTESDSQEQLSQLHDVRIPALESDNTRLLQKLDLVQMELEAKEAEALSTKTQVSMLQDTLAEMRGFLNDPDLKNNTINVESDLIVKMENHLEAQKRDSARLQSELQNKNVEIVQLTSQIDLMEQKIIRSQKSLENFESQMSSDTQSVLHEKALAEQMFSELQKKLTDQFRAESEAKEAEVAALKAHISVLQTALDEMRYDLNESTACPFFSKAGTVAPKHKNDSVPALGSPGVSKASMSQAEFVSKHNSTIANYTFKKDGAHADKSRQSDPLQLESRPSDPPQLKTEAVAPAPVHPLQTARIERHNVNGIHEQITDVKNMYAPAECILEFGDNELPFNSVCKAKSHEPPRSVVKKSISPSADDEVSWQVLSDCPSPEGSAELSSAPTNRDDTSASVNCDVSVVHSSSPSLHSPSIDVGGGGYSISQPSPDDCSHVVEISIAMAPSPTIETLEASNLFQQQSLPPKTSAAGPGFFVMADKENVGYQGSLEISESVNESTMDTSNMASVTMEGRESMSSVADMTVIVDNARRAISAEPISMRTATTSFSRRAFGPTSASLSSFSRHSRALSSPVERSIVEVARTKPQAPSLISRKSSPSSNLAADLSKTSRARGDGLASRGEGKKAGEGQGKAAGGTRVSSRRKRDFSLDSDSD